jgi:hypothetical protein
MREKRELPIISTCHTADLFTPPLPPYATLTEKGYLPPNSQKDAQPHHQSSKTLLVHTLSFVRKQENKELLKKPHSSLGLLDASICLLSKAHGEATSALSLSIMRNVHSMAAWQVVVAKVS